MRHNYFCNLGFSLKNSFDFFLRNHINFSRKNYHENSIDLNNFSFSEEQSELYKNLKSKYDLALTENSSEKIFKLNLYMLNIFDICFSKKTDRNISVLDIGSKNWDYAKSEYTFFKSFSQKFILNGIELDPYRMNSNFYNRYEISKFYTKDLINTNYIIGDFLEHKQKYDYIIWILPFITEFPLIKWGLPLKYFKPEEMLLHAVDLLKEEGELLIINQGEEEYKIQQNLYAKLNIPHKLYGEINDDFGIFKNKRYCSKFIK